MKYVSLFFLLTTIGLLSQELPPIQNFYPKDYHGENQNWAISQSPKRLVYVANSKGLMEFNGASWQLYPSPNETIMRSVKVVDDRIYTGCFMEFGYWQKNNLGTLSYTSISKQMSVELIEDEEFWNIINVDDYVVFQSLRRIYIWNVNNGMVKTIDSESTITKMFEIDQNIYFQRMGEGIFKLESGSDFLLFEDDIVRNDEVINIFGSGKDLLILTKNNGFYTLENDVLVPSNAFPNTFLSNLSLYAGIQLRDKSFVLGSVSDGLLYLSDRGELLYRINQDTGLSNNTVLSLFEDIDSNIWTGLDHGVSYVNLKAPYRVFNDTKGVLGSVYASAVYDGNLYLGTNQGLFYKPLNGNNGFRFINGTQEQVWFLKEIDGKLLCGHNSGTFEIKGDQATKIVSIQGAWNMGKLPNRPGLLLQGNYDGLYVLVRSGDSWRLRNKISGFNNSSRYFETLGNQIFVNHEYNGVFKIEVDDSFFGVKHMVKDTLLKGSNSGLVKYNGNLLYAYKNGILHYDEDDQRFVTDSLLSRAYTEEEYESGKLVVHEEDKKLWIFNKSNISFFEPIGLTNSLKIKNVPLTKEMRGDILGYESIIKLNEDGTYLVGKTSGYLTFNINEIKPKDFGVYIGSITNSDNTDETLLDQMTEGSFASNENNFNFSFYAPVYNKYLSTQYQFRLKGMYDEWSNWSEKAEVFYENLPFGAYTFDLRAKIGNTMSNNTASYSFVIAKPWYISNVMIALYVLGMVLLSFFMHFAYKRYYRKQRQKLIEKNKRELELTQVQNEKEIIRIKNERLEIENKSKSKELAASTMSIIKKNELLTNIKNELNSIEDKEMVRPVIKIIDKSLNRNDDWELFQEAFNNADSEFLKKVKALHPNLSPNDLRLCAYLRLNLSSKEIAQLLHISPRSVEIKRYRLRKKMDLRQGDNLVGYILKL
ncbi:LuxR family transcriptional regulator [Flavobacteriaceae bacterium TP-CH-4]|uniref:LuxR family transcriptional regulator n=1 Tax=Pelagihabitans pacificus TaxID=2696054 RepID=A0A967ASL8_9FLAO|nr:triple tyrosine motif-containing protein [Pelagihabitans pacificus]NHF59528.1 LuxR family transcriptional regulator [Pelagihabitans pacificus]